MSRKLQKNLGEKRVETPASFTLPEHVRELADDHLLWVTSTHTQGGSHLREPNTFVKEFMVTYPSKVEIASKLPAAKKQNDRIQQTPPPCTRP